MARARPPAPFTDAFSSSTTAAICVRKWFGGVLIGWLQCHGSSKTVNFTPGPLWLARFAVKAALLQRIPQRVSVEIVGIYQLTWRVSRRCFWYPIDNAKFQSNPSNQSPSKATDDGRLLWNDWWLFFLPSKAPRFLNRALPVSQFPKLYAYSSLLPSSKKKKKRFNKNRPVEPQLPALLCPAARGVLRNISLHLHIGSYS